MNKICLLITCLIFIKMDIKAQDYLIPEPVSATWNKGYFLITPQTTIITKDDKEQKDLGALLNTYLK